MIVSNGQPVLKNLNNIRQEQKQKIEKFLKKENFGVSVTTQFKSEFIKSFKKLTPQDALTINESDSRLQTGGQGKYILFPTSWYYLAFLAAPYYREISLYRNFIDEKYKILLKNNPNAIDIFVTNGPLKKRTDVFPYFINKAKNKEIDSNIKYILDFISTENSKKIESIETFLTDYNSWGGGKTIDRMDYYVSPILTLLELINQSSTYIADLTRIISESDIDLNNEAYYFNFLNNSEENNEQDNSLSPIPNCIFYGAPGTGKSHSVSKLIEKYYPNFNNTDSEDTNFVFRTTLHPEYTYNDFVGQLMPVKIGDNINYEFTPGVFSLALKKALINPKKYVFLVLEELSRANVASVFGDLFQLLDRKDGISEYSITNSLIANFVYAKDSDPLDKDYSNQKIFLPANLVIIGTVNTNDQNVFVMDTAFKRRFEWEYISTDPVGDNLNNPEFEYQTSRKIKWWDFYQELNQFITSVMNLGEDKQIGQFFIHFKHDKEKNKKLIQNKLLQYLWEDVQKVSYSSKLFSEEIKNFSDLYKKFGRGEKIFSNEFLELLEDKTKTLSQPVPKTETLVEEEGNNEAND